MCSKMKEGMSTDFSLRGGPREIISNMIDYYSANGKSVFLNLFLMCPIVSINNNQSKNWFLVI